MSSMPQDYTFLTDQDRNAYQFVTEGEGENWKVLKGVGADLADAAWALSTEGAQITTGRDPHNPEFFKQFGDAVGFVEIHAGVLILNGPPTKLHTDSWTDQGDDPDRHTALFIYRDGDFTGGEYAIVDEKVGIDVQDGDAVVIATNVMHGNFPRYGEDYKRLAVILCGSY